MDTVVRRFGEMTAAKVVAQERARRRLLPRRRAPHRPTRPGSALHRRTLLPLASVVREELGHPARPGRGEVAVPRQPERGIGDRQG